MLQADFGQGRERTIIRGFDLGGTSPNARSTYVLLGSPSFFVSLMPHSQPTRSQIEGVSA
jgi:hypothetical protein